MIGGSWPSILTSVPDHLPNSTRSPTFEGRSGSALPDSSRPPGPTAVILAGKLFLGGVGDDDAAGGASPRHRCLDDDAIVKPRTKLSPVST